MKRLSALICLFCLIASSAFADREPNAAPEEKIPVDHRADAVLVSSGTADGLAARETAGPDTFALYGGPDELTEGKFQLANGTAADWGGGNGLPGGYGGGPDAWTPVDLTEERNYWHVDTFAAANLNDNGPGNHAMWCGLPVDDPEASAWVCPPGVGNRWDESLIYKSAPLADSSVGQVVQLEFYFNYQAEAWYDVFVVEYDSAGTWTNVALVGDPTPRDENGPSAPGTRFSEVQTGPIVYSGDDYGGDTSDRIIIRLRFVSDGAWSNEDGLFCLDDAGVQLDDISLTTSQGSFAEDFEGPGPYLFEPLVYPFVGDFADVYPQFSDIDPCRDNQTPMAGFLDYGQVVRNGPAPDGTTATGGSTWSEYSYGIPGEWVPSWNGGLSFGGDTLANEIWSPEIHLDLAGPEDDEPELAGTFMRWDVWAHLPFRHAMAYVWNVRTAGPGENWSDWTSRNFLYYAGSPGWINQTEDISDLVPAGTERLQVALGILDYSYLVFWVDPGAAPSPMFDNVAVYKYRLPGPVFATRTIHTAQDGFPVSGSIDVSTPASRDALDIPFNMARDMNTGELVNAPGDSVVVDVTSLIPGASRTDIRLVWALQTNPLFEDALRSAPSGPLDESVVAGTAGTVWTGEVVASQSTTSAGGLISNRYFMDLPDEDFMYPGDVLHYYFEAMDTDGRVSTMPHDTSAFMDFAPSTDYDRSFTVRGLPTITDASGTQPEILVWNDFGRRGGENEWLTALNNLGYVEGADYDTYTTQGPTSAVSNGLGSAGAHGANADQLEGYGHLLYFAGNLSTFLLSDGTNIGNNDKGDDIGLLEDWQTLPGPRNVAYFGDYIATALTGDSPAGAVYVGAHMGIAYGDRDVRDVIGGQTAPVIVPDATGPYASDFATPFVAYGGCLSINEFDQIQPAAGAVAGHLFTDGSGVPIPPNPDPLAGGVASVINPRGNGISIAFPFSSQFVQDLRSRQVSRSARSLLFQEVLGLFAAPSGGSPVAAPSQYELALSTFPNPFNPSTTVKFTAAIGSRGFVRVYNLRGELVATLHMGEFQTQEFTWDGTDTRGASVASGVYVVQAEAEGKKFNAKVALVK